MHRSEQRAMSICLDCGAEIQAEAQAGYGVGAGGLICFDCSIRRGGSYDAQQDHWSISPDLEGLDVGSD